VGDSIYGKKHITAEIKRHFLHAAKLKIILPNETTPRVFEAELPDELKKVLDEVRDEGRVTRNEK
jgi:23S rRNA pseudouridine1911/1915/1917 synthase